MLYPTRTSVHNGKCLLPASEKLTLRATGPTDQLGEFESDADRVETCILDAITRLDPEPDNDMKAAHGFDVALWEGERVVALLRFADPGSRDGTIVYRFDAQERDEREPVPDNPEVYQHQGALLKPLRLFKVEQAGMIDSLHEGFGLDVDSVLKKVVGMGYEALSRIDQVVWEGSVLRGIVVNAYSQPAVTGGAPIAYRVDCYNRGAQFVKVEPTEPADAPDVVAVESPPRAMPPVRPKPTGDHLGGGNADISKPKPLARESLTVYLPGDGTEVTVQIVILGSSEDPEMASADQLPELSEAGWRRENVFGMNIFTRVVS